MTIKKWCYIGFIVIFLSAIAIIIYAKSKFNNVDYDYYIKESSYNFVSSVKSEVNNTGGMNYEHDLGLNDFFIDEEITSMEDLKRLSDYILIITNNEYPTFKGNAIINNSTILKVIKGEGLKENDKIKIYDLLFHWDKIRTYYLEGNTPLQIGNEYIVFLKKTDRASVPNIYVFNSVKYGRVSLLEERGVLENYEQGTSTIDEILKYDFIFSEKSSKEITEYKTIVKHIREFANAEKN